MTAIHQYTYQAWRLEKDYPEISKTLSEIAMVEMRHFHRLGQLISLLGGTPKFFSYQRGITLPWNGKMVDYTADIHKLLKIDIAAEEAAYITYTRQSQCVKDAKVAANLARIAQDEKLHKAVPVSYTHLLINTKKNAPQTRPPCMELNTFGSVTKIRFGPLSGLI